MKKLGLILLLFSLNGLLFAQHNSNRKIFTKADTLRGSLTKERSCFDVRYYSLQLDRIDLGSKYIGGKVRMLADVVEPTSRIQLDLFPELEVKSVTSYGKEVKWDREEYLFYVNLEKEYQVDEKLDIEVVYGGKARIAENAPWDGGLTWTLDEYKRPWVAVSCQGIGASIWWPNKDHLSDEPDSMDVRLVKVNKDMWSISNGTFMGLETIGNAEYFHYKISYPINNYNVAMYVGHYSHFEDSVLNGGKKLDLDYWVIRGNEDKAKKQFSIVPEMLTCFEEYFGPYPFHKDGFALVEAPFAGMEHQSAIAYGNNYMTGYLGADYSGIGLDFDFIIVHEAGHEYWGNSVSMTDICDLWIHEGFCTYAEVLYVECKYGYDKALDYIKFKEFLVEGKETLITPAGVNAQPTGDVYSKGALFLNTLRYIADDQKMFFEVLKSIQTKYAYKNISTEDVLNEFNEVYKRDLRVIFDVYLNQVSLPTLNYMVHLKNKKANLYARWLNVPEGFVMPVWFTYQNKQYKVEVGAKNYELLVEKVNLKKLKWLDKLQYVKYSYAGVK